MYIPDEFKEVRTEEIFKIKQDYPLASIIAHTSQGLLACHIPLIWKNPQCLLGHMALLNEMNHLLADHQEVLCIFQGANAYISANYYPSKQIDHQKVPTWNYQAVHVYGRLVFLHDDKSKIAALGQLTKQREQRAHGDQAWKMSDAPKDYLAQRLTELSVFEITVDRVLAKSKLSQNRSQIDFDNVVQELQQRGEDALAESMLALPSHNQNAS
ncbi:FMN-binding negative transcriptional regulator [Acinetobacter larvae]|uniref:Transcriptional regulator n=1 Tax=Acinetobacter larvae TaxID=1789224 RepID=A0A1B2LZN8_9GAMM|nr:FMN-binding negative transcriptional regulator [Acinetobacter larvae]AOA58412.1 transcriptional regulator [Acinetobacter larvae]